MLHDGEVRADIATVRALIQSQFPAFAGDEVQPISAGTDNAVFRIGHTATARFPLRASDPVSCAEDLRRQVLAMQELGQACPFSTPEPIGIGRPDFGYPFPWTIQTWIDGETAAPTALSSSGIFTLGIVQLVTALRKADSRGRRFDGRGRGGRLRDHDRWMSHCFDKSELLFDVTPLRRLWAQFRDLPEPRQHVMSHKDLVPANLLTKGERLTAVLDAGAFGPADPALDLVAAWHLLDRPRRSIVRDYLSGDDVEWNRGAAWPFQQAMGLVWYYRDTQPRMSELGLSTLSRLGEEFSFGTLQPPLPR